MNEIKKVSPIKSFSFSKQNAKKATNLLGVEETTKSEKLHIQMGNKIKVLRMKHHLTQSDLANQLQVSSAYIGLIEQGKRGGSDEFLDKVERFFNLEHKTLYKLRDQQSSDDFQELERQTVVQQHPDYIQGLLETLLSFDEDYARQKIADFMKELQEDYFNRLTPYELKEVKKKVIAIKRSWVKGTIRNDDFEEASSTIQGCIIQDHHKHYFSLELTPYALQLNLLQNDRQQTQHFESWLGTCSVSYTNTLQLPYLEKKEKISSSLWFNPQISITDMYQYLNTQNLNINGMEINEPRLSWFIQEMTVENEPITTQ